MWLVHNTWQHSKQVDNGIICSHCVHSLQNALEYCRCWYVNVSVCSLSPHLIHRLFQHPMYAYFFLSSPHGCIVTQSFLVSLHLPVSLRHTQEKNYRRICHTAIRILGAYLFPLQRYAKGTLGKDFTYQGPERTIWKSCLSIKALNMELIAWIHANSI